MKVYGLCACIALSAMLTSCNRSYFYGDSTDNGYALNASNIFKRTTDTVARSISLDMLYGLAVENNSRVRAAEYDVAAAKARASQAGVIENPVVSAELEDFAGRNLYAGTKNSQLTAQASQLIRLGGDGGALHAAADQEIKIAEAKLDLARSAILAQAHGAYTALLAASVNKEQAGARLLTAIKVSETVAQRAASGRVSEIEVDRIKVLESSSRIEMMNAERDLSAAREQIAVLVPSTDFITYHPSSNDLAQFDLPSLDTYVGRFQSGTIAKIFDHELERRRALVDYEYARAVPDITVGGGYRTFGLGDDQSFVASISVPIPIFSTNTGAIEEAQIRTSELQLDREFVLRSMINKVRALHNNSSQLKGTLDYLKTEVLPRSEEVASATAEGYRAGKFDLLQVLDAQRSLQETQRLVIITQTEYLRALSSLEEVVSGSSLNLPFIND
jgi:outer membrane protein, heavy metal efflux system